MQTVRSSVKLAMAMTFAAVVGLAAQPTTKITRAGPSFLLEETVPKQFGEWREMPQGGGYVVNPQTQQLLDKLYSQILTRTYVNGSGYRIMLSLAYGDDQRGDLQAHKPEVCYPAQGFSLHSNNAVELPTQFGSIAARQLSTSLGSRKEPVTYWFTVGDKAVMSKVEMRMMQIKLGLTGQIPDGLLFRVSSIDERPANAFLIQESFVNDLLGAVSAHGRLRLSGLGSHG